MNKSSDNSIVAKQFSVDSWWNIDIHTFLLLFLINKEEAATVFLYESMCFWIKCGAL